MFLLKIDMARPKFFFQNFIAILSHIFGATYRAASNRGRLIQREIMLFPIKGRTQRVHKNTEKSCPKIPAFGKPRRDGNDIGRLNRQSAKIGYAGKEKLLLLKV